MDNNIYLFIILGLLLLHLLLTNDLHIDPILPLRLVVDQAEILASILGPYRCQVQVKTGSELSCILLMMLVMMLLSMLQVMKMILLSNLKVTVMILTGDFYLCWLSWNLGSLWLVTPRPRVNFTRLESAPWHRKCLY